MFLRPNCHLVIRAVRVDSPPLAFNGLPLHKALLDVRLHAGLNQKLMAARLNASWKTLQNWERGLARPSRKFWPVIRVLFER
jgi:DNA-binding XRE family transcriptional regulator